MRRAGPSVRMRGATPAIDVGGADLLDAPPLELPVGPDRVVRLDGGLAGRLRTASAWTLGVPLLLLLASSLALRLADLGSWLWMDEGISVGLASHPLRAIPGLLHQDGSPPLYYLVLHGWMTLFGTTETATHALSLVLSLATIPVALWAGWTLFDRRVGWIFAALMAFSPYLSDFATETRMYALLTLLALVATASFLHAFAFSRRRYLWLFAVSLVLVLYTHNWGLWLGVAAAAALIPCGLVASDRRRFVGDALLAFGAVGLAYLPWLPTLAYQAAHTGAPWSPRPLPREAVSVVADLLGDPHERVLVALVLVAGPVLWSVLRHRGPRWAAVASLAVLGTVPVAIGWTAAQLSPSWVPRYLAVCAPAVLLVAAVGLSRAGARGALALALILTFWIQPFGRATGLRTAGGPGDRAVVQPLARALAGELHAGDLVVAMQLEELPVLAYYLPRDLRFATALGPVVDPGVADWRDALARMKATTPAEALQPSLDRSPVGTDVVLVCREPTSGPTSLPWFALMDERCDQWRAALEADPRFTPLADGAGLAAAGENGRQVSGFTKTAA